MRAHMLIHLHRRQLLQHPLLFLRRICRRQFFDPAGVLELDPGKHQSQAPGYEKWLALTHTKSYSG